MLIMSASTLKCIRNEDFRIYKDVLYEMMLKGGDMRECIDHVKDECFQFGYNYPNAIEVKKMNNMSRKRMRWVGICQL